MKKKICFVAQFPPPIHGLSKAVDTLYKSNIIDEFDLEKIDITNNKKFIGNLLKISRSNADLFYFTISQTKGGNFRDLIIIKLLERQHKKCLIHLHGGYYRNLVDNDLPKWQKKANYRAISKIVGAIVLGPSLKYIFQGMIPEEKIFTVANCVDDEYLMSDGEFEEKIINLPNKKVKHILYLSNFIKSKGYLEVLKMTRMEKEIVETGEEKCFHFDFAGKFFEKSEEDFFWNYIKENDLYDYITYYGVVSGDKKRELLKSGDIFVLLTTYPREGQPISILEAMGNGLFVITTNHAGIPDIVEDKVNGMVANDMENLRGIFMELRKIQIGQFVSVSKQNRNTVKTKYSQKQYIDRVRNCYNFGIANASERRTI